MVLLFSRSVWIVTAGFVLSRIFSFTFARCILVDVEDQFYVTSDDVTFHTSYVLCTYLGPLRMVFHLLCCSLFSLVPESNQSNIGDEERDVWTDGQKRYVQRARGRTYYYR